VGRATGTVVTLFLVRGSAALHRRDSEGAGALTPVTLDVRGRRVVLDRDQASLIREAAAARSGKSSAARDLSLLLDRGLSGGQVIALRRAEAQTLIRLAGDLGLEMVADEIAAFPASATPTSASGHWSSSNATTFRGTDAS
jgi:hypothetical protein